jgi:hypothetical protein
LSTEFNVINVVDLGSEMDLDRTEEVRFEGTPAELWALAQLVKRLGWTDVRPLAVDKNETELMMAATERLAKGLANAGYAPR